jgi:hypothetical protein
LPLKKEGNGTTGFTLCLRAKFENMDNQCLFEVEKILGFYFNDYRYKGGAVLNFGDLIESTNYKFDLDEFLTWQSFCITYENIGAQVQLFINGRNQLNFTYGSENSEVTMGKNILLGNCLYMPFKGEISDFNVWSRYKHFLMVLSQNNKCIYPHPKPTMMSVKLEFKARDFMSKTY